MYAPAGRRLERVDLKSSLRVDFAAEAGTGRDANTRLPSPLGARREQITHFMCSLVKMTPVKLTGCLYDYDCRYH